MVHKIKFWGQTFYQSQNPEKYVKYIITVFSIIQFFSCFCVVLFVKTIKSYCSTLNKKVKSLITYNIPLLNKLYY